MSKKTTLSFVLFVLLLSSTTITILFINGCSDNKGTNNNDLNTENIDLYLSQLPNWDSYAGTTVDSDTAIGEKEQSYESGYVCSTTPYSITKTPEQIISFGSFPNILYTGSLIQGKSYMGGLGSLEELPIRQRAPIELGIDLLSADNYRIVETPNAATVGAAIGDLISQAVNEGHVAGSRIFYNQKEMYSLQQGMLSLGLSASFLGYDIKSQLSFEGSTETNTLISYFKQIMFETYVVLPQMPSEFFNDQFTKEVLEEQIELGRIGPDNLPVYVANIQWGRIMVFTMTSTKSATEMKAALKASYDAIGGVSMKAEHSQTIENSTIKLVTLGGDAENALNLLRTGELSSFFDKNSALTTAAPLSYRLCNLADNSTAKVSETTSYELKECHPYGILPEDPLYFENKTEWDIAANDAMGSGPYVDTIFYTNQKNLELANELTAITGGNLNIGRVLTFDSSVTHFPFTFRLRTPYGGMVWNDQEMTLSDEERMLSVGDVGNYENDDFVIEITEWDPSYTIFGVGYILADNIAQSYEGHTISMANVDTTVFFCCPPNNPGLNNFVGVICDETIKSLYFNENSSGDDIFVRDIYFKYIDDAGLSAVARMKMELD